MITELVLTDYKVQQTGADGGHHYISTEIEHKGEIRKLVVLFANKSDESELKDNKQIRIKGQLVDEGNNVDLMMTDTTLEK
ncbi:hypothetical protein [Zobellia barbeyronii]|uniref:Uncharacterized protein n=1 Tax=Zobellia barbeyronii TaxID=2748009 RepID=A0ABS5WGJ6_9FLAO|nr:hypothetical protein [Zobellia barbeyronii]MBT2162260.1 hypothetical protein [Zobellia barbeyronii]